MALFFLWSRSVEKTVPLTVIPPSTSAMVKAPFSVIAFQLDKICNQVIDDGRAPPSRDCETVLRSSMDVPEIVDLKRAHIGGFVTRAFDRPG